MIGACLRPIIPSHQYPDLHFIESIRIKMLSDFWDHFFDRHVGNQPYVHLGGRLVRKNCFASGAYVSAPNSINVKTWLVQVSLKNLGPFLVVNESLELERNPEAIFIKVLR